MGDERRVHAACLNLMTAEYPQLCYCRKRVGLAVLDQAWALSLVACLWSKLSFLTIAMHLSSAAVMAWLKKVFLCSTVTCLIILAC